MRLLIKILLPVCLIAAGVAGFKYYESQKVKMKRKPPRQQMSVVDTVSVMPGTHETLVQAMGTVVPDRAVVLKARVAGEVVWTAPGFVEGGLVKKGETLVRLDDTDYRLEMEKAQNALDKALADFDIEKGQQQIAIEELKIITKLSPEGIGSTDLALRKPQLAQAKAAVAGAKTDLEKTRLDLSRTRIVSPFNALVLEKNVETGSLAAVQGTLATLVNVDIYRVEARVPLDRLSVLNFDGKQGSEALVFSENETRSRAGRVVRATGSITGEGRMAGVIIEVADPLWLDKGHPDPGLLLDDHVTVRITGKAFENVYPLARSLIREGGTVWIYDAGKLKIKTVDIVWKETDRVFVRSGLNPGDQVISSELPAPVEGMPIQLAQGEKS